MQHSATMDTRGPSRPCRPRPFGNFLCCVLALALLMVTAAFAIAESPTDIVAIGIPGGSSTVYTWYRTGFVSQGTSDDLGSRRAKYPFIVPRPLTPANIVGISAFREPYWKNGLRCDWLTLYDDFTMSIGTSDNLARCYAKLPYELPPGRTPIQIVDIGIKKTEANSRFNWAPSPYEGPTIYVFYTGGDVSVGSFAFHNPTRLYRESRTYHNFILPAGFVPPAIVGVDIAPGDDHVFAWFNSGDVMSGTTDNFYRYRAPYRFVVP